MHGVTVLSSFVTHTNIRIILCIYIYSVAYCSNAHCLGRASFPPDSVTMGVNEGINALTDFGEEEKHTLNK